MTSKKKWRLPTSLPSRTKQTGRSRKSTIISVGLYAALIVVLFIALAARPGTSEKGDSSSIDYAIGSPSSGAKAPDFSLPSTSGGTVNLIDYRGETLLLFFHEGIGCQPCWDQIRDLEIAQGKLQAAGIDKLLTITSGPTRLIAQKMADDRLTSVALGDANLEVSKAYGATEYGMAGHSGAGHSFVLVGPDGLIEWRADYGGPPNYRMYIPVEKILSDMKTGRVGA